MSPLGIATPAKVRAGGVTIRLDTPWRSTGERTSNAPPLDGEFEVFATRRLSDTCPWVA